MTSLARDNMLLSLVTTPSRVPVHGHAHHHPRVLGLGSVHLGFYPSYLMYRFFSHHCNGRMLPLQRTVKSTTEVQNSGIVGFELRLCLPLAFPFSLVLTIPKPFSHSDEPVQAV